MTALCSGWLRFDYYGMAAPPEAALVGWGKPWLSQDDCGLIDMIQLPSDHYKMAAFWPFLLRSAWFRRAATPDDTSSPGGTVTEYSGRFGFCIAAGIGRNTNLCRTQQPIMQHETFS